MQQYELHFSPLFDVQALDSTVSVAKNRKKLRRQEEQDQTKHSVLRCWRGVSKSRSLHEWASFARELFHALQYHVQALRRAVLTNKSKPIWSLPNLASYSLSRIQLVPVCLTFRPEWIAMGVVSSVPAQQQERPVSSSNERRNFHELAL
jgi:hypothetical protein